ncbi:putative F420-0 ABC transporter substrate-binding protein [Microbacterium sp. No. 7]|uniref:putative F420-0 ABC transporter substrate-binding protein n=1 Tax=Microbacterium sp. No. 7 TaxID=1714373 RepID=UPI0006D015FD|nr:putative F420-0 ABC transporter substrate-binding protein [Microbacterium sp. No. 7]ALJ18811.1 iron transporter [Microbacterium sp. No. 7]
MSRTRTVLAAPALTALALAAVLTGCGSAGPDAGAASPAGTASSAGTTGSAAPAAPVELDNCGTTVTVPASPPERIVAIKSSSLELLLALGAGDRIVGSAFLDGPVPADLEHAAAGIPVISDKLPSQEAVLDLEPDLVFAGWESNFSADGAGERATLHGLDVTTYVSPAACKAPGYMPNPLTFDDVFASFAEAGLLVGAEDAAAALAEEQRALLDGLAADPRGLTAVWYSSGRDQPYVGAGIGAPAMIMEAAGLTNLFGDVEDTWTSTSWEEVADRDPSVLVLVDSAWNSAASKIELLRENPVTATLPAVIEERFVIVDFPASEAGIRNVDAVATIIGQLGGL